MIDRASRDILAKQLRLLATGKITNDEFENSISFKSEDKAIWAIFRNGAWPLYDDLHEHKLTGAHKLTHEKKRDLAKAMLFLKSNREYAWKEPHWLLDIILLFISLITFGTLARPIYKAYMSRQGDINAWPYQYNSELDADSKSKTKPNGIQAAVLKGSGG